MSFLPPVPPRKPLTPREREVRNIAIMDFFGTTFQGFGQYFESRAEAESYELRSLVTLQNAQALRAEAVDITRAGQLETDELFRQTGQLIGRQRAALAANGIVVDEDTAVNLVAQSAGFGTLDALTALENAERRAAAAVRQANVAEAEAGLDRVTARNIRRGGATSAARSILGGAFQAFNTFNQLSTGA
jgi:hypothetical protein